MPVVAVPVVVLTQSITLFVFLVESILNGDNNSPDSDIG